MTLLKLLEVYRLENKITQQALARDIGVAFSTINRWFNGRTKPNKIQQYHIEKFLKGKIKNLTENIKYLSIKDSC